MEWVRKHRIMMAGISLFAFISISLISGQVLTGIITAVLIALFEVFMGLAIPEKTTVPEWLVSFDMKIRSTDDKPDSLRIIENQNPEIIDFKEQIVIPRAEEKQLLQMMNFDDKSAKWFEATVINGPSASGKSLLAMRIAYDVKKKKQWDVFFISGRFLGQDSFSLASMLCGWTKNLLIVIDDSELGAFQVSRLLDGFESEFSRIKHTGKKPSKIVRCIIIVRSENTEPSGMDITRTIIARAKKENHLLRLESSFELAENISKSIPHSHSISLKDLWQECRGDYVCFTANLMTDELDSVSDMLVERRLRHLPIIQDEIETTHLRDLAKRLLLSIATFSMFDIDIDTRFLYKLCTPEEMGIAKIIVNFFLESGYFRVEYKHDFYISIPHRGIAKMILTTDNISTLKQCISILKHAYSKQIDKALLLEIFLAEYLNEFIPYNLPAIIESLIYDVPDSAKVLQVPIMKAAAEYRRVYGKLAHSLPRLRRVLFLNLDSKEAHRGYEDATGIRFLAPTSLGRIDCISVNQEGNLLAAALQDNTIAIVNCENGKIIDILSGLESVGSSIEWNTSGTSVASISFSGQSVCIWNIVTASFHSWLIDEDNEKFLTAGWSPDESRFVMVSNKKIIIHDAQAWEFLTSVNIESLKIHFDDMKLIWENTTTLYIGVVEDSRFFLIKPDYSRAQIIAEYTKPAKQVGSHPFYGLRVAWNQEHKKLALLFFERLTKENWPYSDATYRNVLDIWDLRNQELEHDTTCSREGEGNSSIMQWAPEGRTMIHVHRFMEGEYRYYKWIILISDIAEHSGSQLKVEPLRRSGSFVHSISWSSKTNEYFVTEGGAITAYDFDSGSVRNLQPAFIEHLATSPTGNQIIVTIHNEYDAKPQLTALSTEPIDYIRIPLEQIKSDSINLGFYKVRWHKDGVRAIIVGENAIVWDSSQNKVTMEYRYDIPNYEPFSMFIDGLFVDDKPCILFSWNGKIMIQSIEDGKQICTLRVDKYSTVNYIIPHSNGNLFLIDTTIKPHYHIIDVQSCKIFSLPEDVYMVNWIAGGNGLIQIKSTIDGKWSIESLKLIYSSSTMRLIPWEKNDLIEGSHLTPQYRSIDFPSSNKFVACTFDKKRNYSNIGGELRIWSVEKSNPVYVEAHQTGVSHAIWSPNGKMLAVGIGDDLKILKLTQREFRLYKTIDNYGRYEGIWWTDKGIITYGSSGLNLILVDTRCSH